MKAAASFHLHAVPTQAESTGLLFQASKLGDSAAIETLIAKGANVDSETSEGTTPLMMAASAGELDAVRVLHDCGATINKTRSDGSSALTLAVFFGHEDVVRELLTYGADINAAMGRANTTLEMWATARGFPGIARLLKESRERAPMPASSRMTERFQAISPAKESRAPEHAADADESVEGIRRLGQVAHITTAASEIKQDHSVDTDDLCEEGIRPAGQTKWTVTAASEIKPPQQTVDADELFDEGIRKVGETEWRTDATPGKAQQQTAEADEFFECIRSWSNEFEATRTAVNPEQGTPSNASDHELLSRTSETERSKTALGSGPLKHAVAADVLWSEGIRRVGQTGLSAKQGSDVTEYYPKVTQESYSPFSTLNERLRLTWKHVGIVAIFAVALVAFGAVTILKQSKSQPQAEIEKPADTAPQTSSRDNQPVNQDRSQSQVPAIATSEPVPAVSPGPSAVDNSSSAGHVEETVIPQASAREEQTVGEPDVRQILTVPNTAAPARRKAITPLSGNPRQKAANRAGKRTETSSEASAPAPVTIVTSPPQQQRVTAPVAPSQPAALIEGSSNKKKVIQWP